MTPPIYITRKQAQKLIEELRAASVDQGQNGIQATANAIADAFRYWSERLQIHALEACPGEVHSNAYIDNCGQCAPRWGLVGPEVKIR